MGVGAATARKRNGYATRSLIYALASIPLCWMLIPSVAAIGYGMAGRKRCMKDRRYGGGPMATASMLLGIVTFLAGALLIVAFWALATTDYSD